MVLILTFKYYRIIKIEKPDISLSLQPDANFINILSHKLLRQKASKAIISMHQVQSMIYKEYNRIDSTIHKIIIELLFNQANSVIVVSEGIKKDLIENFNTNSDKIKVIYNPIDIKKVDAAATESGNEKIFENYHLPIIINVGRLTNQKGQWHLIRILPMILSQVPCLY